MRPRDLSGRLRARRSRFLAGMFGAALVLSPPTARAEGGGKAAVHPDALFQEFGRSLARVGDLNGDGRPEFVIGCKRDIVVDGTTVGGTRVYSGANGSILLDLPAASAVAAGVDANRDGVPDLALGYASAKAPTSLHGGRVEIRSGKDGGVLGGADGQLSNEQLGASVAFCGDFLAAGGPGASPGGVSRAGIVRIFDAGTMTLVHSIAGKARGRQLGLQLSGAGPDPDGRRTDVFFAGWTLESEKYPHALGVTAILAKDGSIGRSWDAGQWASFAAIARETGEGDELLVGYPYGPCGADSADHGIYLYSLKSDGDLRAGSDGGTSLRGARLAVLRSEEAGDSFGDSVASAGDWNGDGSEEILAGDTSSRPGDLSMAGRVWVFSGKDGRVVRSLDGWEEAERLGGTVASAGDLDLDGIPDVLAGAPGAVFGNSFGCGRVRVFSGKTGKPMFVLDAVSGTADYVRRKKGAVSTPGVDEPPAGK